MINRQVISAKAVIFHEGRVLLLEQKNGRWDLPGGRVDKKEPILRALQREVKEETGLDVQVLKLISTHIHENSRGEDVATLAYLCRSRKKPGKKHVMLSNEHDDWDLVKPTKLKKYKLRPQHRDAIIAGAGHEIKKVKKIK